HRMNQNPPDPSDPFADQPRRAPGRRRPSGSSKARDGGSARPLPRTGSSPQGTPPGPAQPGPARRPAAPGRRPSAGAAGGPPPSYAPGSGRRIDDEEATHTRVMPAGPPGGGSG